MTGGNMFGLDGIQSDDELLDRLASRESGSDDELEALLGAWVREIEDDAEEVAGTPMPWMGLPRQKPRAVRVHRAAAVAGALVVTLSGGMAAVALMPPEAAPPWSVGVLQSMGRILPKHASTTASTVAEATQVQQAAAAQRQVQVGTQDAQRPVQQPSAAWTPSVVTTPSSGPGLPPLTSAPVPTSVPAPTTSVVVPPSSPIVPQPPTQAPTSAPQVPTSAPEPSPTPTEPAASDPTGSPEPTPSKTSPSPTPPDVKDSSPVTTPGGVLPEPGDEGGELSTATPAPVKKTDKPEVKEPKPASPAETIAGTTSAPVLAPSSAAAAPSVPATPSVSAVPQP